MRIMTWNMGCAFQGSKYRRAHGEAWNRLEELDPDVAFLQEVSHIPESIDTARVVSAPRNQDGTYQTVVYSRRGSLRRLMPSPVLAPALMGQAVLAEPANSSSTKPIVLASVHTVTGHPQAVMELAFEALPPDVKARFPGDRGSWNAHVILEAVAQSTSGGRFIVGGDFNLAWRFDETDKSRRYWASDQFRAMRDKGWLRPHLKFHAGEERTLFRRENEFFQLDHFFVDQDTYDNSTSCDVLHLEDQDRLSDHAPLMLTVADTPA